MTVPDQGMNLAADKVDAGQQAHRAVAFIFKLACEGGMRAGLAALDCLMVKPQRPTNRKKRRILPTGQQYSRPLDPACRLGSRLRYRIQPGRILIPERQYNRPPPRCHDFHPAALGLTAPI